MPIVRVRDFTEAVAVALQTEGGRGHTLSIHSQDISRITTLCNAYQRTVFVANGSTEAAEGVGGEGFVAMSLAGHTGEGFTTAATFVKHAVLRLSVLWAAAHRCKIERPFRPFLFQG